MITEITHYVHIAFRIIIEITLFTHIEISTIIEITQFTYNLFRIIIEISLYTYIAFSMIIEIALYVCFFQMYSSKRGKKKLYKYFFNFTAYVVTTKFCQYILCTAFFRCTFQKNKLTIYLFISFFNVKLTIFESGYNSLLFLGGI